jgi:phage baseplate assembly protein W
MGSFNFKSSGKTAVQQAVEALVRSSTPIGIKTPLRLGTQEGIFAMNYNLADQVHDNLRNLLQTNWGERLCAYDFGANLRPITSELASQDDFDAQAVNRISTAVAKWMPYISLDEFLSEIDHQENKNTAIIRITITYSIPALNVTNRSLQITLYAM